MRNPGRTRIDYQPCMAAVAALEAAAKRFPEHSMQALVDRLVITGLSALEHQHWVPPALHGQNRNRWRDLAMAKGTRPSEAIEVPGPLSPCASGR